MRKRKAQGLPIDESRSPNSSITTTTPDSSNENTKAQLDAAVKEADDRQAEMAEQHISYRDNIAMNPYFIRFKEAAQRSNSMKETYYAKHPPEPMSKEEIAALKRSVSENLKDPDSAKFKDVGYDTRGDKCGMVNAKNSFGAYTGFQRFTVLKGSVSMSSEMFPAETRCLGASE